jgi:hypothetical protein
MLVHKFSLVECIGVEFKFEFSSNRIELVWQGKREETGRWVSHSFHPQSFFLFLVILSILSHSFFSQSFFLFSVILSFLSHSFHPQSFFLFSVILSILSHSFFSQSVFPFSVIPSILSHSLSLTPPVGPFPLSSFFPGAQLPLRSPASFLIRARTPRAVPPPYK